MVALPFDRAESPQSADLQAAVKVKGEQRERERESRNQLRMDHEEICSGLMSQNLDFEMECIVSIGVFVANGRAILETPMS